MSTILIILFRDSILSLHMILFAKTISGEVGAIGPVNFRSVRGVLNFYTVLLTAAMTLFPVFIGIFSFRNSYGMIGRDMDQALTMEAGFLVKWMNYHQNAVRSLSRLSSVRARDFTRMDVDFSGFVRTNANFISIVYVNAAGKTAFSIEREGRGMTGIYVADRHYFTEALQGRECVAEIITSRSIDKPVMIYSVPLMDDEGFGGLIFASIPFDALLSTLESTPFRSTGSFYLYHDNGSEVPGDAFGVPAPDVEGFKESAGRTALYSDGGKYWIARGLPLGEHGLTLAVRMELWEFLTPYLRGLSYFAAASLLLLVSSLFFSRALYRRVDTSISRILAKVEKTGEGIFIGDPIDNLEDAPIEMKKLGDALNEMSLSLKKMTGEIEYRSFHDILTGLYNRRYFEDAVERLATGRFDPVTVIVCDVDGLKLINDSLGHKAGDRLIISAAEALRKCFRQSDIIARIGGDEFAALMPEDYEEQGRSLFPEKLAFQIEEYRKTPDALPLNISWGTAAGSAAGSSLAAMIHEADKKMYAIKQARRNSSREDIQKFLEAAENAGSESSPLHSD